jgi:C_GCAxxG_C_C family probable redox protein
VAKQSQHVIIKIRRHMIEEIARRSGKLFESSGLYCAESVVQAIAEGKGLQSDLIPRMATGFCSGLARTCGMCGAVNGAILAISLFHGRNSGNDSVDPVYTRVRKLLDHFEREFGSTNCRELTGCDLGTEAGQEYFKENRIAEKCVKYTETATRWALTLIEE